MAAVTPVDTNPAGTLRSAANVTVYASQGGTRYHQGKHCEAFSICQWLWRWDPDQWVPGMPLVYLSSGYPLLPTTALDALGEGKTPCAVCLPGVGTVLARSSCEDDYGHQPVWRDVGQCGIPGCQCPGHEEHEVCARCHINRYRSDWLSCFDADGDEHRVYGSWLLAVEPIAWPCTTAVVLGLVDREQR